MLISRIKGFVEKIVRRHGTRRPLQILKEIGVTVLFVPLGSLMGFQCRAYRKIFVHINESLSEAEINITAAHELGHILLHKWLSAPYLQRITYSLTDQYEAQANTFAAELLFPDELLDEYPECSAESVGRAFGVTPELLRYKTYHGRRLY